ncbi:MAG: hypothetical protein QW220_06030 [Candidatus Bathyarchaeia archaeon]
MRTRRFEPQEVPGGSPWASSEGLDVPLEEEAKGGLRSPFFVQTSRP